MANEKTENKATLTPQPPIADKKSATTTKGKAKSKPYEPSELVIKEVMVQKGVTRDEAIRILKNPTE